MANRFWESSLGTEETKEQRRRTDQENNREEEHAKNTTKPTSESESISDQESRIAPETEKNLEFLKEFEAWDCSQCFLLFLYGLVWGNGILINIISIFGYSDQLQYLLKAYLYNSFIR
ncbi:hypothetical protein ACB092_11G129600 [Castanea dentata]